MHQPSRLPIMVQPLPQKNVFRDIPPGLECLTNEYYLYINQKVQLLDAFTNIETENRYEIFDSAGRPILFAQEQSDCFARNCFRNNRPFDMSIVDGRGMEVIYMHRPLAISGPCCVLCCPTFISIEAPRGNIVGSVEEECSFIITRYIVKDTSGNVVLRIKGPCFTVPCCCEDVTFRVLSADGSMEVGEIAKKWSGFAREAFTDADSFGVHFPKDLDVKMKAVLIGACFLINFMFFEREAK